jgi:hypothetical protein
MSETPEKPKIIIDEDWKSQVQKEKAAADQVKEQPAKSAGRQEIPAPTLSLLFTTFATQAMVSMGEIPNPITGKVEVRIEQAKHFVDTLALLEEKTTGHRTPEESAILSELLHQLRLAYVMAQAKPPMPS